MSRPVIAVVCARMGSSRFSGKALEDVAGVPVLKHTVDRVRLARSVNCVVVAAASGVANEPVVILAQRIGVPVLEGPEDDVVARMALAVDAYRTTETMVWRVMLDQPFLDWQGVDDAAALMSACGWDLVLPLSWGEDPVYGAGLTPWSLRAWDAEVLHNLNYREHPGLWIRANLGRLDYGLRDLPHWAYRPYRLELDTPDDLELVRAAHAAWGRPAEPPLRWVVDHLDRNPALLHHNAHVKERTSPFRTLPPEVVRSWKLAYAGRPVVWSDAAGLVGEVRVELGRYDREYRCRECGGQLMALTVVHGKGHLRLRCTRCSVERVFYAERK